MGVHSYTMKVCCIALLLWFVELGCGVTDPNDLKILLDFKNGLDNPELLNWPEKGDDPCGSPPWPHVFCSKDRVAQIQVQNMGIKGTLPQNFNQLSQLYNIGLQRNKFYGKLPTFKGLSMLEFAFLDYNDFDTIPSDFFEGLSSIRVLALDGNPLNKSTGWSLPPELANLSQLVNLTMSECNLVGPLPDFLGTLPSLNSLTLSSNKLFGEIPRSFGQSSMRVLWLDSQAGAGLTGPIDVIAHMTSLTQLWLQGNSFTGKIPDKIGDLSLLRDIDLNTNQLVGFVPKSLADMQLENLDLSNNRLMGPVPAFKAKTVSYKSNPFCQTKAGEKCAPEVNALLDFLGGMDYPFFLASQWSGNDPCQGPWLGVSCDMRSQKVSVINLPRRNLTGFLSPSIGKLDSLVQVRLGGNKISGTIPSNLTDLISLKVLDVSGNNLGPPLPTFRDTVKLVIDGNPLLAPTTNQSHQPPSPAKSPPIVGQQPPQVSPREQPSPPTDLDAPPSPTKGSVPSSSGSNQVPTQPKSSSQNRFTIIATVIAGLVVLVVLTFCMYCFCMKRKVTSEVGGSFVVHPRNSSDPENAVKIAVSSNTTGSLSSKTGFTSVSSTSGLTDNSHTIESGSLVISVQVLRKVTSNFSQNNELGRGGFGTVYKGELEDGTKLAVKRMEAGIVSNKAVQEFEAEISVLSKVRHRHLVSLLGYSIEGSERLLVYEYMLQGALSRHLFHWKNFNLKPLSWTKRLSIALDVARAMEYLHSLGRQTFIHRDLKSSNILLGEDFHAKVSDFGLVKLAPDGENSVVTRLAGTFGYLAPEYAVMGKVTTKTDVFSFGVVLMELVTGLMALDEKRSEESRYLAEWFWRIKSSKEKLMAAIDPALDADDEGIFDSISIIAELAGHCTAREPTHRPDMRHAVNVLSPLVEIWKPISPESDDFSGIDYSLPLPQMLKVWQDAESTGVSCDSSLEDSKGSIPARPAGFAESFTSADGR